MFILKRLMWLWKWSVFWIICWSTVSKICWGLALKTWNVLSLKHVGLSWSSLPKGPSCCLSHALSAPHGLHLLMSQHSHRLWCLLAEYIWTSALINCELIGVKMFVISIYNSDCTVQYTLLFDCALCTVIGLTHCFTQSIVQLAEYFISSHLLMLIYSRHWKGYVFQINLERTVRTMRPCILLSTQWRDSCRISA